MVILAVILMVTRMVHYDGYATCQSILECDVYNANKEGYALGYSEGYAEGYAEGNSDKDEVEHERFQC